MGRNFANGRHYDRFSVIVVYWFKVTIRDMIPVNNIKSIGKIYTIILIKYMKSTGKQILKYCGFYYLTLLLN